MYEGRQSTTLIQTCHPHGCWPCPLAGRKSSVGEGADMEEKWGWKLDESGSNEKTDGGRLKRERVEEGIEMEKRERERWGRYCQI